MGAGKVIAAVLAIGLGVATQLHLQSVTGPYLEPTLEACKAKTPEVTGVASVDFFLCFIVPFFKDALSTLEGYLATGAIFQLAMMFCLLGAIEASRLGSGWLLSQHWLFLTLGQLLGISVVVPLVWIPAYLFFAPSSTKPKSRAISQYRVYAIVAVTYAWLFLNYAPLILEGGKLLDQLYPWFILAPVFVPLLWLPIRTTASVDAVAGHRAVITSYWFAAGTAFAWHVYSVLTLLKNEGLWTRILGLYNDHPGKLVAAYFMSVDTVVMLTALTYFILLEGGLVDVLGFLAASVVVSPGTALAGYLAIREKRFLKLASHVKAPEKKVQ